MAAKVQDGIPIYFDPNQQSQYISNAIVAQPIVIGQQAAQAMWPNFRPLPQWANGFEKEIEIQCQYCKRPIITLTKKRIGCGSAICSLILCVTMPILFWVPFVKESCKDVVHICPNCGHDVGQRKYKVCSCS